MFLFFFVFHKVFQHFFENIWKTLGQNKILRFLTLGGQHPVSFLKILKNVKQNQKIQISDAGQQQPVSLGSERKLIWGSPGENVIEFYLNFNWNWWEIDLGQPRRESDWISFKFWLKLIGNQSGAAQERILLNFI